MIEELLGINASQAVGLFALFGMVCFVAGYAFGGWVVTMDIDTGRRKQ